MNYKKVTTWKQLLADPRVVEVWFENNDGETSGGKRSLKDIWIELADGWKWEGCQCVHEWSKADAIAAFNNITEVPSSVDRAAALLADVAEASKAKFEAGLAAQVARQPFSLLTYKATSDIRPFWSATVKAASCYEACVKASEEFGIPLEHVDCTIS